MTFLPPFLPDSPLRTVRPAISQNVFFDGSTSMAPVYQEISCDVRSSSACGGGMRRPIVESQMIQGILEAKLEAARRTHQYREYLAQSQVYGPAKINPINTSSQRIIPLSPTGDDKIQMMMGGGFRPIMKTAFPSSPINKTIRSTLPKIVSPVSPAVREKVQIPVAFTQAILKPVVSPTPLVGPIVTGNENRPRLYIDRIEDCDVLCGRGGKSNHHPGNKRYRQVISDLKLMYRCTDVKNAKTDLSRTIVDYVCKYGGRFVKLEESTGKYYLLTKAEARKKTSQALRETKELKWIR